MTREANREISTAVLEKAIKENPIKERTYDIDADDEQFEIVVKPYLSAQRYSQLVHDVVLGCVSSEGYIPSLREFSTVLQVLAYCTNIPTDNISVAHEFICCYPETVDAILCDVIDVFPTLRQDIEASINFEVQKQVHESPFAAVADKLCDILDTVAANLDGVTAEEVLKLTSAAERLGSKSESEIAKAVLDYQRTEKTKKQKGKK